MHWQTLWAVDMCDYAAIQWVRLLNGGLDERSISGSVKVWVLTVDNYDVKRYTSTEAIPYSTLLLPLPS